MPFSRIAKRFTASAAGVLVARLIALVSVFAFNAILARSLCAADFGQFVLIFSSASVASLFACVGLNRLIVRRLAEDEELSSISAQSTVVAGVKVAVLGGCIVGLVTAASSFFFEPSATSELSWRALLWGSIILLRTVHLVIAESLRGMHERVWSNLFGSPAGGPLPHLLFVILLAIFAPLRTTLWGVLSLYAVSYLVTFPVLWFAVQRVTHACEGDSCESVDVRNLGLLSLGLPLMFTQTCGLAMSQADIWIAGAMVAPAAIAIYGSAQRMLSLLTVPLQIAGTAIVNFVPGMAKQNRQRFQDMVGLAANIGGIPGVAMACVFLLFAETILTTVFGPQYANAASLLRILTLGQIVCLLTGPCEISLMMAGHERTTLKVNVIAAVTLFIVGAIATQQFGLIGLAATIAFVTATQNLVNWMLARQLLGVWTHVGATGIPSTLIPKFTRQVHA